MKKISIPVLVCLIMLLVPVVSFATMQTFSNFSIDVPQGWQTMENGNVVALIAPDRSASMSIAFDSAQGMSAADLANAFVLQMKGSTPQPLDDGGYAFTFTTANGIESQSILYVEGNQYMMITTTGDHPDFGRIIDSLE
ncbi:hypothetical protein [Maridesulfovibrio bastinii]|uniref:hypothetical protein n=1 Tax=Maridesulfovibrio bastinii TaxID=47157 RepID=UPI0004110246|nr:hypothetical protein [Maridesulfovibrio bastinii]